jgi:hypothetical protein
MLCNTQQAIVILTLVFISRLSRCSLRNLPFINPNACSTTIRVEECLKLTLSHFVQAFHCFLMVVPTTAKMDTLNRPTKSNFAEHLNLHLYCKSVIFVVEVHHVWIPLYPKTHPERVFYNPQFLAIKYCDIYVYSSTHLRIAEVVVFEHGIHQHHQ